MKKNINFLKENKKMLFVLAGIIVLAVIITIIVIQWRNSVKEKQLIQQGIGYLESLEEKDVSEINAEIKEIKAKYNLELVEENPDAVWIGFEDAVILGDSRAVGFYYHEFLPEERVLAKGGGKITDVSEYIETLQALNPGQIFLCYGLNDVGIGYWPEVEEYSAECDAQIQVLMEALPQCDIYLNSILPAVGAGLDADADYVRIGDYNTELEKMCEEKGYNYIDNTTVAEEYIDLYDPDGLHVKKEFYKFWAANMLLEVE